MGVDGGDGAGGGGQSGLGEGVADGLYDGVLVGLAGALAGKVEAGLDGLSDGGCGLSVAGRLAGGPEGDGVLDEIGGGYYLYTQSPDELYGAGIDPGDDWEAGAGGVLHRYDSRALEQGGELGAVLLGIEV